jgi:TM2 domain-containing membrane protein YozV
MNKNPILASFFSLIIPGFGQLYCGETKRGLLTLVAAIIIGNANLIFVLLFTQAGIDPSLGWEYWMPRIGHDVVAFWSVVFWVWVIVDAHRCARKA